MNWQSNWTQHWTDEPANDAPPAAHEVAGPDPYGEPERPDEVEEIGGETLGEAELDERGAVYRTHEPSLGERAKKIAIVGGLAAGIYYGGRALLRAVF